VKYFSTQQSPVYYAFYSWFWYSFICQET